MCAMPHWGKLYFRWQESRKTTQTTLYLSWLEHSMAFKASGRKAMKKESRVVGKQREVIKLLFFCPIFAPAQWISYLHDPYISVTYTPFPWHQISLIDHHIKRSRVRWKAGTGIPGMRQRMEQMKSCGLVCSFSQERMLALELKWVKVDKWDTLVWTRSRT